MTVPINEIVYEKYAPMVKRIAAQYANRYRMVDVEDVRQELWLWFASHPNKTNEWLQKDVKDADPLFARSLRNAAHDYCVKEKANVEGYNAEDNFWYTKDFIKLMLPATLSDDWKRVEVFASEVKGSKSPAESGDWMAYSADIKKAYKYALSDKEKALVLMFYANDVDADTLHKELGEERPSAKATQMAANRAINKMVNYLGGFAPRKDNDYEIKDEDEEEVHDDED